MSHFSTSTTNHNWPSWIMSTTNHHSSCMNHRHNIHQSSVIHSGWRMFTSCLSIMWFLNQTNHVWFDHQSNKSSMIHIHPYMIISLWWTITSIKSSIMPGSPVRPPRVSVQPSCCNATAQGNAHAILQEFLGGPWVRWVGRVGNAYEPMGAIWSNHTQS